MEYVSQYAKNDLAILIASSLTEDKSSIYGFNFQERASHGFHCYMDKLTVSHLLGHEKVVLTFMNETQSLFSIHRYKNDQCISSNSMFRDHQSERKDYSSDTGELIIKNPSVWQRHKTDPDISPLEIYYNTDNYVSVSNHKEKNPDDYYELIDREPFLRAVRLAILNADCSNANDAVKKQKNQMLIYLEENIPEFTTHPEIKRIDTTAMKQDRIIHFWWEHCEKKAKAKSIKVKI